MVRQVSQPALTGAYAQETAEVYLTLLTVTAADLPAALRFSSDNVDTTSRGDVYQAFPFRPVFPADQPGEIRPIQLAIDNIDRQIVNALRSAREPISVLMEVVLFSSPDTVEASFSFDVVAASYADTEATLTLAYEPILDEPFPYKRFSPAVTPGLF